MPTQVQFRRGTTLQNNNFTGAAGELSVDITRGTLRVHDGVTVGGTELATVGGTSTFATNLVGGATGSLPYQSGANTTDFIAIGPVGTVLASDGTTATWSSLSSLSSGAGINADNVFINTPTAGDRYLVLADDNGNYVALEADKGANAPIYNLGTGLSVNSTLTVGGSIIPTTSGLYDLGSSSKPFRKLYVTSATIFIGSNELSSVDQYVTINGTNIVTEGTLSSLLGTLVANTATNIASGTAGAIPYQTAPGATGFVSIGGNNSILVSNGSTPSWSTNPTIGGNLTIAGNLIVQGTTTAVDSTVTNVSDPIFTLGGGVQGAAPSSNDGKDRGIAFQWHNGSSAKIGFFGYDNSTGRFAFVPDATITSEVVSGSFGILDVASITGQAASVANALTAGTGLSAAGTYDGSAARTFSLNTATLMQYAVNLSGGAASQFAYQSAANTTAFISTGSMYVGTAAKTGYQLTAGTGLSGSNFDGSAAVTWTLNTSTLVATATKVANALTAGTGLTSSGGTFDGSTALTFSLNTATLMQYAVNVSGGAAGNLVYQSGASATALLANGTAGNILVQGATNPTWTSTSTLYVNRAVLADTATTATNAGTAYATIGTHTAGTGLTGSTFNGSANQTWSLNTATFMTSASKVGNALTIGTGLSGGSFDGSSAVTIALSTSTLMATAVTATNAANAYSTVGTLTAGTGLSGTNFNGSANQTWTLNTSTLMQYAVNVSGGAAGNLHYQSGASQTALLANGTAGQILVQGATNPTWTNTSTLYVNRAVLADTATTATNAANAYATMGTLTAGTGLTGTAFNGSTNYTWTLNTATLVQYSVNIGNGTAGQLVYQSGASATGFVGPGTAGQLLVSNGASAPVYTNTSSIGVGFVGNALTAGTGISYSAGTTYNGSAAVTISLNTSTLIATATKVANALTAGTGLTGSNFDGSAAVTWTLNTSTLVANAVQANNTVAALTAGTGLTSGGTFNGSTARTFSLDTSSYMASAVTANNLAGGSANQFAYQTGAGATSFMSTGTMYVGNAAQAVALKSGTAGAIVYQSGANASTFLTLSGTQNSVLAAGASAPVYVTQVQVQNGTSSSSQATGQSLVVTAGGLGVTGDSYFANNVGINGTLAVTGAVTFSSPVTFNGTATYVLSTNTIYTDNIVELHSPTGGVGTPWFSDDGKDIGFRFHYYTASTDTNAALVLANDTKFLEWYSSGAEGTSTFAGSTYGTFKTGVIKLVGGNATNNATSGDLQVTGGVGIGGGLFVTGVVTATTFVGAMTGTATQANNLNNGTTNQIPYQSAANTTAFFGPGTAGQLLVSNGTTAGGPVFTNTSSIGVGFVGNALTAGTGITYSSGSTYNGSAAITVSLNTATFMTSASKVGNAHTAGTGLSGSTFDGSAAVTWTLNTATLMQYAVNLSGGTANQFAYQSAANTTAFISTGSMYVGTAGKVPNVHTAGTGLSGSTFDGSAAVTWTLNTATFMTSASKVGNALTIGTGLSGSSYDGSSAVTIALSTSTLMQYAVTATNAANAYATMGTLTAGTGLTGSTFNGSANQTWTLNTATLMQYAVNVSGGAAGNLHYQSGASATALLANGTAGNILVQGATNPTWTSTASIGVGFVGNALTAGTGISYSAGTTYNGSAAVTISLNTATFVTSASKVGNAHTAGTGLSGSTFDGSAAVTWTLNTATLMQYAVNVSGGAAGNIVYQSGASATALLANGTAGQILVQGATNPTWTSTSTLYVNRAVLADTATTATNAANAYSTVGIHTAGTGLSGSTFNGSANQTWTLNTATLMQYAVNLSGGAGGSIPYQSAANTTALLGIGSANTILTSNGTTPAWSANPTIGGNVTITGNLTVQGTTTYVDSTVTNIGDPVITIGGGANGAAPASDDGKDRGIAFQWYDSSPAMAKIGFFGFDRSSKYFTFFTSATITNEVAAANGGTTKGAIDANLAGGVAGNLVYQSAADTTAYLTNGTAGQVLVQGATNPTWTNTSSLYVNRAVLADTATTATNAANAYSTVGTHTAGTGLSGTTFNGSANVTWTLNTATLMQYAVNVSGGAAGSIVYQSGASASTTLAVGSANQVLTSSGTAPQWSNASSITGVGSVANALTAGTGLSAAGTYDGSAARTFSLNTATLMQYAVNVSGGAAGNLHYQSGASATALLANGTAGNILVQGATNPTWTSTASIGVGFVGNALTAGTGISYSAGTTYNGSAAVTISLNTATFVTSASKVGNAHTAGTGLSGSTFDGSAAVTWTLNTATLMQYAVNVSGGAAGNLHYQSGASATALLANGTAGNILVQGATNPTWTSTASIGVGFVGNALTAGTGITFSSGSTYNGSAAITINIGQAVSTSSNVAFGSIGVGTPAPATTGAINATNEITAYYSDRRLKENVKVIDNAVVKVLSLNGITYTPNDLAASFGYDKTTKLVGLFADEVEAILPEATRPAPFDLDENGNSKSGENYKTIQYEKLVPLLIEAIKEQQQQIAQLSEIVNKLATK